MSSKLKSETARINGAKSHGPHTTEGKAKSSTNSRTHGLAAKYARLPNESAEEFQLLFDDYVDQFHPQTAVETELVEMMVIARCRLRRLLAIETHLFEVEISRRDKQIDREFANLGEDPRLAWVFQKLADNGQSIALLIRYEGSINRSYEKALKQLLLLQSHRPAPPSEPPATKIQNEPKPDPAVTETRPNDVGQPILAAADFQAALESHPPLDPKPSKTPIQPQKPTSNVNPTIPVRDSVS
jgi:hypothetical protein